MITDVRGTASVGWGGSVKAYRNLRRSDWFLLFGPRETKGAVGRCEASVRPKSEAEGVVSCCAQNRSIVSGGEGRKSKILLSCSAGENRHFEKNVRCTNPGVTRYRLPFPIRGSVLRRDAVATAGKSCVANRAVPEIMDCIMEDNAIDTGAGIAGAID